MAMAVSKNITINRSITSDPLLIVFSNESGAQVDLTGWNVYAQVRKKAGKAVVLDLNPTILPTGTLLGYPGEVDGPGRVKVGGYTDEQTLAMATASLLWDIVLEDPSGARSGPYVTGNFVVTDIITEPV